MLVGLETVSGPTQRVETIMRRIEMLEGMTLDDIRESAARGSAPARRFLANIGEE